MRFGFAQIWNGFMTAVPTLGVALLGLSALGWMMLTAPAVQAGPRVQGQAAQIGVIIAPWRRAGMGAAAQFNLPIIALRWGGHLVVLDTSRAPAARGALQNAGYLVIETAVSPSCYLQGNTDA